MEFSHSFTLQRIIPKNSTHCHGIGFLAIVHENH